MQQIIIDPSSTDHQFHYLKDGNTYDCTFLNSTITCTMAIVETAKDVFIGKDTPIGPVVGFQMTEFTETVFILMGLILITLLFRIIVTSMPQKLSRFFKYIPESASVIVVGVIIGGIIRLIQRFSGVQRFNVLLSFNDQVFFLILIPPLILESGYFLNKEFFAKHLTLILLYAVVGTFLNSIVTGLALWVFGLTGAYRFTFSIVECLLFGTLISAVDPVAVLSIFDDLKVNEMLYMLVFGESVLNDSVSIVLFNLFAALLQVPISRFRAIHALLAFAKLVYISAGGIGVGILFGFIGSFLTRFTSGSTLYEPLVVLLFSFASYFVAESILSSGIVAILFCGAFMSRYVKLNIAKKSHTTLKYGLKLIASTSETLIFIYFGISIVLHQHKFDLGFTAATLVFILFFRFLFIFSITVVYNLIRKLYKLSTVSIAEQIILSYSGLRGIVFALAFIIPAMNAESQEKKDAIITTTMIASCFTIFIQGSTIRPLMSLLSIKKESSTCKQMSQALVDERIQLNMEEVEVANAMRHVMYLESTVNDLPKDNPERLEFEQVNRMVIEQILFRVLDEIEELNDQLIESNENYVNSEGLYGVLDTNSHIFERLAKSWREHIELIGLEKHTGTSSEALSALGRIRETVYQKSKQITAAEELHHDIECPISPKKDDREACFLLDLLEDNGVIFWSRNSEYCLSDWAKDDRVIFYIQRLLQEENIRYWIDQANEILEVKDYSRAKSLLRVLRFEIQRQQEIRNAEIDNLKRVLFAAKVFSLGIKRSMDVVSTLAGRNNTGKRYVRNVDKLVQKVCVRGLYAEESALIGALQSLKKFEFAYADTENQTEDEEVFIQQIEEQEEAIRVVQEATENENVNLQRCMSDADVNSSIAGTELVSLLELEKDTIDSKEYEERIQTKVDLISQREKDMLTAAKTRHRLSDPDVYCEQIKQAQKRYECKLAEVLTPIPGTGPSPGTFSRDTKEPSPSIFNRKRSLGSYSATKGISPHVFSPLRSSGVHSAEYSSNVPSPSIFGRRIRRHSSHIARSPLIGEYSRKRALSESREPNFLMVHSPETGHEFEFPAKTKKTRKQPSIADRRGLSTASELDLTLHLPDIAHPAPKPHHEDEVISLHDIPTHTTNNSSNKNKEELRRLHHSRSTSIPTIIITHDEDDPEEDSCKRK